MRIGCKVPDGDYMMNGSLKVRVRLGEMSFETDQGRVVVEISREDKVGNIWHINYMPTNRKPPVSAELTEVPQ
ncbi:hypothetical protein KC851_00175 [Candidatus Kaiserbacteria bacterium]|nr:hypothetical protein [Candidatus Kaiserbacteria bacterium]